MYQKVDPGHQPVTKDDEQPKDAACSCECGCRCNCASGAAAFNHDRGFAGPHMTDNAHDALQPG
ncbi:hypothetical protein H8E07_12170 [bacterium]|nr:hypothetical protein [bacterium]